MLAPVEPPGIEPEPDIDEFDPVQARDFVPSNHAASSVDPRFHAEVPGDTRAE
jgi:hypothetical protein